MNSCSKQEIAEKPVAAQQEIKMSDEDINVLKKIKTFKQKVKCNKENRDLKMGEIMCIDSAIWYLESTINYNYGHPDVKYNNIFNYTDSVNLNLDANGNATFGDVIVLYDIIIDKISNFYYDISGNQKNFIIIDIYETELQNVQMELIFTASVGSGWEYFIEVFDETDYWYYGYYEGKCGPYSGNSGEDAATNILDKIHYYQPVFDPGPGYSVIYTDVETIISNEEFDLNPSFFRNPEDPEIDNYLDYYMFYASSIVGDLGEEEECLYPLEMNFYFNGTQTMIYNKFPTITDPPEKIFIKCVKLEGLWEEIDEYNGKIRHNGDFEYGIRHIIIDEEDIPEELPSN
ncbi:MAG: hypothetical protein JEY97_15185 [Bacteroidales bacterium]|nr:hypothetical protein [Bacteroidales bacterium]